MPRKAIKPFQVKLYDAFDHEWIELGEKFGFDDLETAKAKCDELNIREFKNKTGNGYDHYGVIQMKNASRGLCVYPGSYDPKLQINETEPKGDLVSEIETVIRESLQVTEGHYEFRRAFGFLFVFPWSPDRDGWIIHRKGKPWQKEISFTSDMNCKTYGKWFPTFVWTLAENLWKKFPKEDVYINGQSIKWWSHAVQI
ncbi:MAG: hypothetical protein HYV90_06040 [Candidatus Woesebacteria bacterium]|nr:MAG: hypothetical protein HYV90_06040 [Candidatus Woesebacteria bacterium]